MNEKVKCLVAAACAVSLLAACGKKETDPGQGASVAASAKVDDNAPRFKQTARFGTVSTILLDPLFQVPAKYANYVRQDVTEVSREEYRKLPQGAFEKYIGTWLKQDASAAKPDWNMIAALTQPGMTEATNEFKKQALIEQAKTDVKADPAYRNAVYGWQGEILGIDGPDVATGEYYLVIRPGQRTMSFSYANDRQYRYELSYFPVFNAVGMTGDNTGTMQLTVKVPIEKAREIESLREGSVPMIRVYGHIAGVHRTPLVDKKGAEAGLEIEVEALEFGARKNGEFKTFFFLDTDQLKRSKA